MRAAKTLVAAAAISLLGGVAARADVTISNMPTQNMSCSGGVCAPTAKKAVLNIGDLANLLAGGDVKVTTGSGATNIVVKDAFSWTSACRLTLDAIQSVEFDRQVTVAGTGAVTITTNDGGSGGDLLFDSKGSLTFWDLSSSLVINGNSYVLVKKLKDLRNAIANATDFVALAGNYNAQKDGTYSKAVIGTVSANQTIEGLGNQIQNLTIASTAHPVLALIKENAGVIRDLGLTNVNINSQMSGAAGLVYSNEGTIRNCFVTGTVRALYPGGLVNTNLGTVSHSHASTSVFGGGGGLVWGNGGTIETSYATGAVTGGGGGLVGENDGTISQSFATGAVTGATVGGLIGLQQGFVGGSVSNSYATGGVNATFAGGGLIGANHGGVADSSYSTGLVAGSGSDLGGFVGEVQSDSNTNDCWDLDTSGIDDPHRGAGDFPDDPGITGLTTAQLQSALPPGFDPKIWAETAKTNGGLPYLRANPPVP